MFLVFGDWDKSEKTFDMSNDGVGAVKGGF
jgi:hypothetical protein